MHELSIAQSLLALCEENARKNNAKSVKKIEIKIGRLSGIEAHYLESAFSVIQPETVCENAELICHVQDVIISCKSCGHSGSLDKNEFLCPKCGSDELLIKDGEEMYLMRLELGY